MTKITRAEYILIKALKLNISFTEARSLVNKENGDMFNLSKQNGDTVNINKIYTSDDKTLTDFFKSTFIFTNGDRNNRNELLYYANFNNSDLIKYEKIRKLIPINNSLFNNSNSIYKKILIKIKQDYEKVDTNQKYDRLIISGKNNTAANYAIEYKNNIVVLTYSKISFSDIYDENFKIKKSLNENIIKKIEEIECLELFEKYNKNFKIDFLNKVNDIILS